MPPIILRDRLAEFLGAADGGLIEYHYADVVRLAGHSCPTVAGAYLMTSRALKALYGDDMPERGDIRVDFRESQAAGVVGVTASVIGMLTGAAGIGGFKGLAGNFSRRDLLRFESLPESRPVKSALRDRTTATVCRPNCNSATSRRIRAWGRCCSACLPVSATR